MRRARYDIQGYYYHVICRGQRKNPLFFSEADMDHFVKILSEILTQTDIEIFAFCLMKNHFHLLLKRNEQTLHSFMKRLNTKYALYFNRKYDLVGHVFQDRYRSIIILNENYLINLTAYIHMNPVRVGITDFPEKYRLSSALHYKDPGKRTFEFLKILPCLKEQHTLKYHSVNNQGFPLYKDSVGDEFEYLNLEKRFPGREKGKFIPKRGHEQKINSKNQSINNTKPEECIKEINMDTQKKYFTKEDKKKVLKVIEDLLENGYNYSEIARSLNRSKSWITMFLIRNSKKK